MSRSTFELLRIPAALVLILIAAFVLWPRGNGEGASLVTTGEPSPSVVVGQPGGEVVPVSPSATIAATPGPTATPTPTAEPTPEATPEPTPASADGFTAEVLVCRSISGGSCNDQLSTVPGDLSSFTALVRFTDATAGDTVNAVLSGPSGTIPGGAYTLQGGGDGYYYSTFQVPNLPNGDYTVTATRNGSDVATTGFTKEG
jgi:hypothetical protein